MKTYLTLIAIITFSTTFAQKLDEDAKTSAKARGEENAEFFKGEEVYTYEANSAGWYKIRKEVYAYKHELEGKEVPAGTEFRNKDWDVIGKALSDLKLKELDTIKAYRSEDKVRGIYEGYVFKTKIDAASIPENKVEKILAIKNRTEQQELFEELWYEHKAEDGRHSEFKVHVIRESNKTIAQESDFRIIVIFRGTSVFGIITNGHSITAEKVKHQWEDGDFKAIYFYKPTSSQMKTMEDIVYEYMAL